MAAAKKGFEPRKRRRGQQRKSVRMVFVKRNYVLLLAGLAFVVVGYVIMRMENEVDGFISLYVAPLMILGGYLEVMYAIFYREKEPETESQS
jgi:L-asparagine transporter-like permease